MNDLRNSRKKFNTRSTFMRKSHKGTKDTLSKDKNSTNKLSTISKLDLDWIWKKSGSMKEDMNRS